MWESGTRIRPTAKDSGRILGLDEVVEGQMTSAAHDRGSPVTSIRLTIPAKAEYIALGRLALTGIARLRPLTAEALGDLKLALTEACTNSVKHAYPDNGGRVGITYELYADKLVVEVVDDGAGFRQPQTLNGDDGIGESGLGLAIIRAVADDVEIGDRTGGGASLRFVKHIR
jgi:serine/threonine-protein kinase RsbW